MIRCNPANHSVGRGGAAVEFVVLHFTAGNGDTAENNCRYFANNAVKASAHYFVDEGGWAQSVEEADAAWHCGAQRYVHSRCRNGNSIGVELCSRRDDAGRYYLLPKTVENAVTLTRQLLDRYQLLPDRVLRHYDVTGKQCPLPFVEEAPAWQDFLHRLEPVLKEPPRDPPPSDWAAEAAAWTAQMGLLRGDEQGAFHWRAPVSRQELALVLYRLEHPSA